jgi:hypothetical protein
MPTYKGHEGYELLREDINHVWGQGWFTSREYYGLSSAIQGLRHPLAADGWEFNITNEGAYSRCMAQRQAQPTDPGTDYYDRYTITTETIEKDIWTLDAIHAGATSEYGGDFKALKDTVESVIEEGNETFLSGLPEASYPVTWAAYREIAAGVMNYEEQYKILTRERVVSVLYGTKLPLIQFNTATIYTTDQLKAQFGIPDLTGIAWPTAPTVNIPNTKWGWRNRRQDVQQMEGQKVTITEDWAWAAWSTNLYTEFGDDG